MLRDYQIALAEQATAILTKHWIVYLAMEMRVGKSLIALATCKNLGARSVLFVTKKKAISSVEGDFRAAAFDYALTVTNFEALHNVVGNYDVIIIDEAHSLGAYPKPSERTKKLKSLCLGKPVIFLSGTPTPESHSQLYHQLWVSECSPFREYKNFYAFAKKFVHIRERIINGIRHNDYSRADMDAIAAVTSHLFLTYTQKEAGFAQAEVQEEILTVHADPRIVLLAAKLLQNRYHKLLNGNEIVCDSAVKLQNKLHQIYSGTVITESGESLVLDKTKAEYIARNFSSCKFAVFYKFKAEERALREVLSKAGYTITLAPEEFNASGPDTVFLSQIQSGSMGVNLSAADALIFYNIDFSATQYWQARARLQTLNRTKPARVYWLFAENGIEEKIYKAVINKKDYTTYYFAKDYALKQKNGINRAIADTLVARTSGVLRT